MQHFIPTPTASHLATRLLVLSDFDGTLCDEYLFDETTNNHLPVIRPEVIRQAAEHTLIIATARRASHPAIEHMWASGLVNESMPIISENGGVIQFSRSAGGRRIQLAPADSVERIATWLKRAMRRIDTTPTGVTLRLKRGDTMVIARYQTEDGLVRRDDQQLLHAKLMKLRPPKDIALTLSGESVCIQHQSVNKAIAFRHALRLLEIERSKMFVIGIGDALNDRALFERLI